MSQKEHIDKPKESEKPKKNVPAEDDSVDTLDTEEEDDLDISKLIDRERIKEADELIDKYREKSGE